MEYWIVCKMQDGKYIYVSDVDDDGNIKYSENESEALKIHNFNLAMRLFGKDHTILKRQF